MKMLGISGSGRKKSFNTALLKAAAEMLPPGATLEIFDVSGLPLFNQDQEASPPPEVVELKRKVREADALVFATPEHNFSITATLKNAIEWANRPPGDNAWDGKPAAIVSASTSLRGGARAQAHLRQVMADVNMHPINRPQLYISRAQEAFDQDLKLTDEAHKKTLKELMASLVDWAGKLSG